MFRICNTGAWKAYKLNLLEKGRVTMQGSLAWYCVDYRILEVIHCPWWRFNTGVACLYIAGERPFEKDYLKKLGLILHPYVGKLSRQPHMF
jgi:hypothetical protein